MEIIHVASVVTIKVEPAILKTEIKNGNLSDISIFPVLNSIIVTKIPETKENIPELMYGFFIYLLIA